MHTKGYLYTRAVVRAVFYVGSTVALLIAAQWAIILAWAVAG